MASQIVSKFVAPNGDEYIFSDSSKAEPGTASPLMDGTASTGTSTKYARENHVHPSDTSREAVSNKTTVVLGTSDSKYPTDKAVADFVNSSVATNTANYISNNGQPFTSVTQLEAYTGTVTNNDYAFVTGTDSAGNTYYDRYKATVSGSTVTWSLEYRLNNSSFTSAQWTAINSGITTALVGKIHEHANKTVLDGITADDVSNWNGKAASTHTHGNITNGGALQTTDVTIASGDKLVITDSSDSNKVARASISFNGSTATKALTQKGTWETFNNYTHPTTSGNKHVPSGGSSGQFLGWSADGTAAWVANPNTDTKVTSSANHYTPATAAGSDKSASASGATSAWGIDVVKGVTLQTDGKGHITGISVTSGKVPSGVATTSAKGLMSSTDKAKLDGFEFMSDTENDTMITNIISSAH